MKLIFATAIVALTLPVLSLADVSGTATLTATTGALNLDAGSTAASGGDLLWNGTTLTPQGGATAATLTGFNSTSYGAITQTLLSTLLSELALAGASLNAPITPAANSVIAVKTKGGNYAKVLVTSNSGGSLGVTYTTYGTTGGGGGGGGGGANAPTITDVQNAASNIPSGLPNGGIAQGAMFVVKGSNLGPATFIQQTAFPFTTSIGGTSIQVTVGSTTVDVIMFYSLAAQVAGILPSNTPTGSGTLKLTYNGQSATFSIKVVQNNIGIYTVKSSGSGDAIAFLNSDAQLITPTHAAKAGDVIVLWGTGLGPVSFDEKQPAVQSDMTNVPLQVYIGGQAAKVDFRGRNGCCTSVDSIYVEVPEDVTGCAVSVVMQIGNIVSNGPSIAIADDSRKCTPINQSFPVGATGSFRLGALYLERSVTTTTTSLGSTTTKGDASGGIFENITYTSGTPGGSQLDVNSYGSCTVTNYVQGNPPSSGIGTVTGMDAGPSIALTGPAPVGSRTLTKSAISNSIFYGVSFDQTATTLAPGDYTFNAPGGSGTIGTDAVGPFTATYTVPPIFAWTEQPTITSVNRGSGVTVHWTGGNPDGYVIITGTNTFFGTTAASTVVASFSCTARVRDQMFAVPPIVLLSLPPSGSNIPNGPVIPGTLFVESYDYKPFGPPPGLDEAIVESFFLYGSSVTYQ
jgi:uncharacterized protein (TIGR03437 family)